MRSREASAQMLAADPAVLPLATRAEAGAKGGRGKAGSVTTSFVGRGATYLVRRLKRDHPAIAEALGRGEFKSARAAGKAAGIVKEPTPFDQDMKLLPKLSEKEREAVRQALAGLMAN